MVIFFFLGIIGESKGVVFMYGNIIVMCGVLLSFKVSVNLNKVVFYFIFMFYVFGFMVSVGSIVCGLIVIVLFCFDFIEMFLII